MKISRTTLGLSLAALAALAIGSGTAWARPVVQALTGPEASAPVQPLPPRTPAQASAAPGLPQLPQLGHEPLAAEPSLPTTSDVKDPTTPTPKPASRAPRRVGTASLDLRDPWGEGSYPMAQVAERPRTAALDLVDPWDPSHSYAAPVAAERTPLLDPWTTPGR